MPCLHNEPFENRAQMRINREQIQITQIQITRTTQAQIRINREQIQTTQIRITRITRVQIQINQEQIRTTRARKLLLKPPTRQNTTVRT